jgi:hypothetical protein
LELSVPVLDVAGMLAWWLTAAIAKQKVAEAPKLIPKR